MTSRDLLRLKIIDDAIAEPLGGAHRDHREAAANLKSFLIRSLREVSDLPREDLLQRRYDKFRRMGVFNEGEPEPTASLLKPCPDLGGIFFSDRPESDRFPETGPFTSKRAGRSGFGDSHARPRPVSLGDATHEPLDPHITDRYDLGSVS